MTFSIVTVATKNHVMLDLLKSQIKQSGEELNIYGLELNKTIGWESHGNLGLKLQYLHDIANHPSMNDTDIILFVDAFDVVYSGDTQTILKRFETFKKPLVFGAELLCSPNGNLASNYPDSNGSPFKYLNSGFKYLKGYM